MDELAKLLEPTNDKKPERITLPLSASDFELVQKVRARLGRSSAAEIARKGIRASLIAALESFGSDSREA
jgi:hypothetical protein